MRLRSMPDRRRGEGGVRTRGLLRAQTPAALDAIREAIRVAARRHVHAGGVEFPMPAVLSAGEGA